MTDEAMIDTTIIVYAYDKSEPTKRQKCKELIDSVFKGGKTGFVSNQILGELFVVLTKKIEKPVSLEDAENIVNGIIESDNFVKVNYNQNTVKRAMKTVEKIGIHFWDAVIAETMLENNVYTIYTENEKDFKKVPKLKVINPLTKKKTTEK